MTRRPEPAPPGPDAGKPRRAPPWTLTDEDRAAIRAAVDALPPLTEEQADALCDVIIAARKRWQREDTARGPPTGQKRSPHGPGNDTGFLNDARRPATREGPAR